MLHDGKGIDYSLWEWIDDMISGGPSQRVWTIVVVVVGSTSSSSDSNSIKSKQQ